MVSDTLQTQELEDEDSVKRLKSELAKVRTGRATANLFDSVTVDYYGTKTKLNQMASISIPEARMIMITPFDKGIIQEVEKAILAANLGFTPQIEGSLIRISVPPLTEERRKELSSVVKKFGEEGKVALRNHRRDANESLKKAKGDKVISEDEMKSAEKKVQGITDKFVAQIDSLISGKEKEIMTI